MSDGLRLLTAGYARALQSCTSRIGVHFLLTLQEVTPISKTRNQLNNSSGLWFYHSIRGNLVWSKNSNALFLWSLQAQQQGCSALLQQKVVQSCANMQTGDFMEVPLVAEHRKAMLQRAGRDPHIVGWNGTATATVDCKARG